MDSKEVKENLQNDEQKYFDEENQIPKYVKKKNSSTSRSSGRSDHKHVYEDCLLTDGTLHKKAMYCTVCGKIFHLQLLESEKCGNGLSRLLTEEEIAEKYKDLPKFEVASIYDKFL